MGSHAKRKRHDGHVLIVVLPRAGPRQTVVAREIDSVVVGGGGKCCRGDWRLN